MTKNLIHAIFTLLKNKYYCRNLLKIYSLKWEEKQVDIFQTGDKIRISVGGEAEVLEKLGEGGQGEVYRVKYAGSEYALKWYYTGKIKDIKAFYSNVLKTADSWK